MVRFVWYSFFCCFFLCACSDEKSTSVEDFPESSSESVFSSGVEISSCSTTDSNLSSSNGFVLSSSSEGTLPTEVTRIVYELKPFEGPLANPHKGFTVPIGGTWTFVPEFEYGPYGSLNNRAWDLITYGSGYFRWDKLNPVNGIYDWTELDKLLDACKKMG